MILNDAVRVRFGTAAKSAIARVDFHLGMHEQELIARREAYTRTLALDDADDEELVWRGQLLAGCLLDDCQPTDARVREAHVVARKVVPLARRTCGPDNDTTLDLRRMYAFSLFLPDTASRDDVAKATTIFEDLARTVRRRASSDCAEVIHAGLEAAREKLSSLETKRRRSTRTQAALEAAVLAM